MVLGRVWYILYTFSGLPGLRERPAGRCRSAAPGVSVAARPSAVELHGTQESYLQPSFVGAAGDTAVGSGCRVVCRTPLSGRQRLVKDSKGPGVERIDLIPGPVILDM